MKLYEELVAKQHPAVTWDYFHIQAALTAIDPALILKVHGHADYLISGVLKEGLFPGLPWRTGCVEYGYYNTPHKRDFPTPTGWFFTPQYCLHNTCWRDQMNPKEAIVFFLPMILVFGAFIIGFFVFIMSGHSKENKARYEHGKQTGALTARDIGCTKAYKIAEELPECAYKDGYVKGIASIEDNL